MKKYVIDSGIQSPYFPEGFLGDSHRYETDKGIISMVRPCFANFQSFEIYSIKGELFDDVERYYTIEDAERRIIELLGTDFKFGR